MQHIKAASSQQGCVEGSRRNPKNLGKNRGKSHQSADKFAEGPGTWSAASEKAAADVPQDGQDEGLQLVPDSVMALDCSSVVGVAVAGDVPLCVSCAGAHAEFVCSECELRELLGHFLEAAHGVTTCPSAKVGRRRLAQLKQMMVSAELEERVRREGSPTLLATLSEIQLYLMA